MLTSEQFWAHCSCSGDGWWGRTIYPVVQLTLQRLHYWASAISSLQRPEWRTGAADMQTGVGQCSACPMAFIQAVEACSSVLLALYC
jgi:hypothetical protein